MVLIHRLYRLCFPKSRIAGSKGIYILRLSVSTERIAAVRNHF